MKLSSYSLIKRLNYNIENYIFQLMHLFSKEKEREKDLEIVEGADREYEKLKENDFWLNP